MRVFPISNNNLYPTKTKLKSIPQPPSNISDISFKANYHDAFKKLYSSEFKSGDQAIEKLRSLVYAAKNDARITIRNKYFEDLPYIYRNIPTLTNMLSKIYRDGTDVAFSGGNRVIYMMDEKSITFRNPNELSESVIIGIDGNKDKYLFCETLNEYCYDRYEYYNELFFPISKHEHVSGSGFNAVSTTKRFHPDGTEKSLLDSFLDWF